MRFSPNYMIAAVVGLAAAAFAFLAQTGNSQENTPAMTASQEDAVFAGVSGDASIAAGGALTIDDTHKEVQLNTAEHGIRYPMSSMPGEPIDHVFAGPMQEETIHFVEAIVYDRPVMVKPAEARLVMDVYVAADMSDELGEPVSLPRNDPR